MSHSLNEIIYKCYGDKVSSNFIDRLHMLLGDWQVLARILPLPTSFVVPSRKWAFVAAAHCRPATGTTVHMEDVVGLRSSSMRSENLSEAMKTQTAFIFPNESRWAGSYTVHEVNNTGNV